MIDTNKLWPEELHFIQSVLIDLFIDWLISCLIDWLYGVQLECSRESELC